MADFISNLKVAGFIAKRVAFNRQRSFSRFIIRLSIAATVIGVAVMIITLSFANGFQEEISQKVFSFWGHIRIQEKQPFKALIAEETPIIKNDTLVDLIKQNPNVQDIHPFATKYAILKTKEDIEGVLLKGFDPTYNFDYFKRFIKSGKPISFNDSTYSRNIMISVYTAAQLKLKVDDRILIYFIRPDGSLRPDKLTVSGIYKTGIEEYDKTFAVGDIKLIQRLNDWYADEIGGYEIFLDDYRKIDTTVQSIYNLDDFPPTWDTQGVQDISPNIFDWLNMQNTTRNVLIGSMLFVAIINLITCLLILVLERVRMIGVLKSLGAKNLTVQIIFLFHGLIITLTGVVIGTILGLGFLYLQKETGFIKLQEEAYYLSEAAVKIVWWQVLAIVVGTFVICLLILMIPSILVRKIQPVKAIQFR
jgi:lipoprotein-releasing system permease protein